MKELKEQIKKIIKEYKKAKRELEYDIEHFNDETAIEEKGGLAQVKNFLEDLEKLKNLIEKLDK